jgi:hypothetical protein
MQNRFHRVGKDFLIENDGQGESVCYWKWYAACRDRGMHQFGHRGEHVGDRSGARFTFWKDGKSCFTARAVCEHCRSMIIAKTYNAEFRTKDDEEMCKFFMLIPLAHPASMLR